MTASLASITKRSECVSERVWAHWLACLLHSEAAASTLFFLFSFVVTFFFGEACPFSYVCEEMSG